MRNGEYVTYRYHRDGDIIIRDSDAPYLASGRLTRFTYSYNNVWNHDTQYDPYQSACIMMHRYIRVPISHLMRDDQPSRSANDLHGVTLEVPYHPHCPYAAAILFDYPEATVYARYHKDIPLDDLVLVEVYIKQDGHYFYTPKYPTIMTCQGNGLPTSFRWLNVNGSHRDDGKPAIMFFAPEQTSVFYDIRRPGYHGMKYDDIIEAWYLNADLLYDRFPMHGAYYNNGLLIPEDLITEGIIDPKNFNADIDTFTIEMAAIR